MIEQELNLTLFELMKDQLVEQQEKIDYLTINLFNSLEMIQQLHQRILKLEEEYGLNNK